MSVRFGTFFGQSDEFWHGIQIECDFRNLAGEKEKIDFRYPTRFHFGSSILISHA